MPLDSVGEGVAVAYLARGADSDWAQSCERFLDSYKRHPAGVPASLYILFKGFSSNADLAHAKALFSSVSHQCISLSDTSFDIGAYIDWAKMIKNEWICPLKTTTEILAPHWLRKLSVNLAFPNVGLVGATGSYESLKQLNSTFPAFPNIHIRSTAFLMRRGFFCELTDEMQIDHKVDAWQFESGPQSLTRRVLAAGKKILVVGRNGRGYAPQFWATSDTFRQRAQNNLLIADNQTRNYLDLPWEEKRACSGRTWGQFLG